MMSPIEPAYTMPCRFAAKSPLMMFQVVTAVRLTRSYTEGHTSSAGKTDVCKDVAAEEMAAGPRTETTSRRTATTAAVASTRTGTHTEAAALEYARCTRERSRQPTLRSRSRTGSGYWPKPQGTLQVLPQFYREWVAQLPPPPLA